MELFEPKLSFIPQLDNTFLLRSVTLTPNGCYSAGPAREGLPAGQVVTPETVPVILELRLFDGICHQAIKPVYHQLPVVLGPGKNQVTAFVVLDGEVLGQATGRPGESTMKALAPDCFPTEDWIAIDNQMPPGPRALYVAGTVVAPTPGYTARLEAGASIPVPNQLPLSLIVEKLPGVWPPVVTPIPVRYDQQPYDGGYETVAINQGDCPTVVIKITEAH
ncbi:MAG: hypothetical protein AAF560_34420 [Acidobacteriota bacterium]